MFSQPKGSLNVKPVDISKLKLARKLKPLAYHCTYHAADEDTYYTLEVQTLLDYTLHNQCHSISNARVSHVFYIL